MNPAFSVILLTTASGAGYGMLFWLGILDAAGVMPPNLSFGIPAIFIALALASIGLLASTLHLGHPERAWRAISQWRSSWLSREGVVSLFTYLPALAFAAAWGIAGPHAVVTMVAGVVAALCGMLTVFCQAMIYASLPPVRQWHNRFVPPNLVLLSLASGAACLAAMVTFWLSGAGRIMAAVAFVLGLGCIAAKIAYWRWMDREPSSSTIESATGLGTIGAVRQLEAPHIEENFLLREMGFRIGRKHGDRLRGIAIGVGFVVPAILLIVGIILGNPAATVLFPIAAAMTLVGVYVERWLFFAQATHTVTLYYGRAV
ncbi:MAG TPA: DmsC/YnfH family molybdoenzyme membrane anchor subunit [Acetobacteraceae bacterium]